MPNRNQKLGQLGESLAVAHLKKKGYRILERNYRNLFGEIDIIARHGESLVFVEVKSRRSDRYGGPKFALTSAKRKKISMVALSYLKSMGNSRVKARFDVVAVGAGCDPPRIEVVRNAFELAYP